MTDRPTGAPAGAPASARSGEPAGAPASASTGRARFAAAPARAAGLARYEGPAARLWEIDFGRGCFVLMMICDHILYDLAYVFTDLPLHDFARNWYFVTLFRQIFQPFIVTGFLFLSGISCSLSRSNFKRGMELALVAVALTLVTGGIDSWQGQPDRFIIRFGILHMLAAAILIYGVIEKINQNSMRLGPNRWLGLVGGFSLVVGIPFYFMPATVSQTWLACLIYSQNGFYSADYEPLLPWLGIFLIGGFCGQMFYWLKQSKITPPKWLKLGRGILFVGRRALPVYLLHQPLIYVLLYLISQGLRH